MGQWRRRALGALLDLRRTGSAAIVHAITREENSIEATLLTLEQVSGRLAGKLAQPAQHIWGVFLYQQKLEAVSALFVIVLTVLFVFRSLILIDRWYVQWAVDDDAKSETYKAGRGVFACVGFLVALLLSLVTLSAIAHAAQTMLNPDYAAIQAILRLAK